MATITWSCPQVEFIDSLDGHSNVVNKVHWRIEAEDSGKIASNGGTVSVSTDDLSSFTPYADLTEDQCLQWAKNKLGAERCTELETQVTAAVNAKVNPTTGSGTPWVTPESE